MKRCTHLPYLPLYSPQTSTCHKDSMRSEVSLLWLRTQWAPQSPCSASSTCGAMLHIGSYLRLLAMQTLQSLQAAAPVRRLPSPQ